VSGLTASSAAPGLLLGEGAEIGEGVSFGAYAVVHDGARVGDGVSFGAHVVVHEGTRIGDGCTVEDHAVLGKRPRLAPSSGAHGDVGALDLGAGVTVCAGAVVFAGTSVGEGTILGDQSFVRERTRIGPRSVIGRGSAVDNDVRVGARVRIQTNVYLTAFSVVEDDVFVGPGVTTTNDDSMARHEAGMPLRGALLRRACRIGGGAVLTPGVEIGEEAFVACGAVVTRDVRSRAVVMGVPAHAVREVPDEDLLEHWR
jgi:acetyltransferase-like isoleucine patch superfamily enzyme